MPATPTSIYDLVTPETVLNFVRSLDFPDLVLQKYMPTETLQTNEYKIDTTQLTDEPAADYRAWDTEVPIGSRQGISFAFSELAPLGKKKLLTEEQTIKLNALKSGDWGDYIDQIYDDLYWLTRGIHSRWELDRGSLLGGGSLNVGFRQGDGTLINKTVTYNVPGSQVVTASPLWSSTGSADPIADIQNWIQQYMTNNRGLRPGRMLVSQSIVGYLQRNAAIRSLLAVGGAVPTVLSAGLLQSELTAQGFPPIDIITTQVPDGTGAYQNVLPANKVIFLPPDGVNVGRTMLGVTAEAMGLAQKGTIQVKEAPGIVGESWDTPDSPQRWNKVAAVGLPVLSNYKLLMIATVA